MHAVETFLGNLMPRAKQRQDMGFSNRVYNMERAQD